MENVLCAFEKNRYFVAFGWNLPYVFLKYISAMCLCFFIDFLSG